MLLSLGYIGITTRQLDGWSAFASSLLGMQVVPDGVGSLGIRVDDRSRRLFVDAGAEEGVSCMGWEVADAEALAATAVRLENAGVAVTPGSRDLADRRRVRDLISLSDPLGNRVEIFHGSEKDATPFEPGRSISGFRTGGLGLGHVVLTAQSVDMVIPFYRDILGFRLSDYALRPFKAYFFHLNARHHSFAVVETGQNGFHHLMVELNGLDDVGQAYDLAQLEDGAVGVTLGRHTNDFMTSFYWKSPSGFMIEYGWGGRSISPETWEPFECDYGPSLWGHERSWLSEEKRAEARGLRIQAAKAGYRAPVYVTADNHILVEGT